MGRAFWDSWCTGTPRVELSRVDNFGHDVSSRCECGPPAGIDLRPGPPLPERSLDVETSGILIISRCEKVDQSSKT
jgi:hypothetical protein